MTTPKIAKPDPDSAKPNPASSLLANPMTRLVSRALFAGFVAALTQIHSSPGHVLWPGVVTGGALATLEVFTPVNVLVGVGKK